MTPHTVWPRSCSVDSLIEVVLSARAGTRPIGSRPAGSRPTGSRPPATQRPIRFL
ncbi:hypothetical protein F4553_003273 [Allocatelliglobosispora scoriae]|uniref:Uncharacterized protein n=1 Tax=Allocatelliglobosispora scoriae TaxID=643052 RepID=A0A841BNP7_9ACTN|nr:hypothetical protein [Allocatelliglobosispora scoriae]